ncbi:hypothetical protein ACHAWO_003259 [Cyclotella atomus]|uniref:Lebercilin domain-containing protein n=1 Tax=Cyclotella atomus TaxID=382360 RepID=A0ABD3Q6N9_9STRA
MVCMSNSNDESPRNEVNRAEPLDRMEELAKLQERRQQRLLQLRELRSGKPVSSWACDLSSNDAKLNAPNSASPKLRKKKSTRATLSKSLPPNVTPPFVNQKLLKKTSSASGKVEGRGRSAAPVVPMKREESPHPARLLTRMKSVDAPADDVDFTKRHVSKTRHSSAQMQRKTSNSRQSYSNVRANAGNGADPRLNKTASFQQLVQQTLTRRSHVVACHLHQLPRSQMLQVMIRKMTSLNKLRAEFKTLRDAKAKAEATADKLRTEFSLQQQEIEAQLLSLSSENERLKSAEIKLQVELVQGNEKLNKAEQEKCALRSRLLKSQNDKLTAESKVTILEAENASLHKALNDLAKNKGYGGPIPEELFDDIQISGYARSA